MGLREGVNKFIAGIALGGALTGAPAEAEATNRFAGLEARLAAGQADRERAEHTVTLDSNNMNDILFQTATIDSALVFVDESGEGRCIVDGDGNELFPTDQSGLFEVSINGTRYPVPELSSINGTIYAIPSGFERIEERNTGLLVPTVDTTLPAIAMTVSSNLRALQENAYLTTHDDGSYLYATKDTGAPVQLLDSTGAELFPDEHGQFSMQFRGERVRVLSLTEYGGNVYAVPEGYVLDIVEGQEPAIRTTQEQAERRNLEFTEDDFTHDHTASR